MRDCYAVNVDAKMASPFVCVAIRAVEEREFLCVNDSNLN